MNDQRYVLVLLLCLIAGSNSQLGPVCASNQQLMNTVVYEGNSSSFFNQIDPSNVNWGIAPSYDSDRNPPYTVADDNSVQSPFIGVYTVTPTKLSIPKASIYNQSSDPYSTSGLYVLTYKTDDCVSMANLIVVSRGPVCQCTATGSGSAVLSCQLDYGVAQILPNHATMTWYTASADQVFIDTPTPNMDDPYYSVATSTYSITSSDDASYTCGVTFTAPDYGYENMAANAPSFTASCTIANCVKP